MVQGGEFPLGPGLVATFANHGAACRIDGVPVLWHTEPGSGPALVPVRAAASRPTLTPAAGSQGSVLIVWTGPGQKAPVRPGATHYHDLALGLANGSVPLPGATIDVLCGDIYADWE